jgi:autotransporter passenger strand-loop-strand repeat protein
MRGHAFRPGMPPSLADRWNIVRRPSLVIQPPWFVPPPCHPHTAFAVIVGAYDEQTIFHGNGDGQGLLFSEHKRVDAMALGNTAIVSAGGIASGFSVSSGGTLTAAPNDLPSSTPMN